MNNFVIHSKTSVLNKTYFFPARASLVLAVGAGEAGLQGVAVLGREGASELLAIGSTL